MAVLPPKFLNAVVTIGAPSRPEEMKTTGQPMCKMATGFLYLYPLLGAAEEPHPSLRLWIVTCKHVIEQIKELNQQFSFWN